MHILYVSSWWPYPATNGAKTRIYNLLQNLSQKHMVTLLAFADEDEATPEQIVHLRTLCARVEALPKPEYHPTAFKALAGYFSPWPRSLVDVYSPHMNDLIRAVAQQTPLDVILAFELQSMRYLDALPHLPGIYEAAEVTVFLDQVESAPGMVQRLRSQLTLTKLEHAVRGLMERGVALTVVSEAERELILQFAPPGARVEVIPNGVDTIRLQPDNTVTSDPYSLIYTGAVTYRANYDAVVHFIQDVWPLIRDQYPQATFTVTGSTKNIDVSDLALQPGVIFSGFLPSITETLHKSCALVVPLRIGSGTRLKILEAMALGVAVISTTKGVEGLHLQHDEHLLIADTPRALAGAVSRLFQDAALRQRLVVAARQQVEHEYDWQVIAGRLSDLVEQVAFNHSTARTI